MLGTLLTFVLAAIVIIGVICPHSPVHAQPPDTFGVTDKYDKVQQEATTQWQIDIQACRQIRESGRKNPDRKAIEAAAQQCEQNAKARYQKNLQLPVPKAQQQPAPGVPQTPPVDPAGGITTDTYYGVQHQAETQWKQDILICQQIRDSSANRQCVDNARNKNKKTRGLIPQTPRVDPSVPQVDPSVGKPSWVPMQATVGEPWTPTLSVRLPYKNCGSSDFRIGPSRRPSRKDFNLGANIYTFTAASSVTFERQGEVEVSLIVDCRNAFPPDPMDPSKVLDYAHEFRVVIKVNEPTSNSTPKASPPPISQGQPRCVETECLALDQQVCSLTYRGQHVPDDLRKRLYECLGGVQRKARGPICKAC